MPPAGFEPEIPVSKRPHIHALDRAVSGIGQQGRCYIPKVQGFKKKKFKRFCVLLDIWVSDFLLWRHVIGLLSDLVYRKFVNILQLVNNRIITNGKSPLENNGKEFDVQVTGHRDKFL